MDKYEGTKSCFEQTILWDDWRIIKDVRTHRRCLHVVSHVCMVTSARSLSQSFPSVDVFEPSDDLLHQLVEETSQDHPVTWVGEYFTVTHGEASAKGLLAELDYR